METGRKPAYRKGKLQAWQPESPSPTVIGRHSESTSNQEAEMMRHAGKGNAGKEDGRQTLSHKSTRSKSTEETRANCRQTCRSMGRHASEYGRGRDRRADVQTCRPNSPKTCITEDTREAGQPDVQTCRMNSPKIYLAAKTRGAGKPDVQMGRDLQETTC